MKSRSSSVHLAIALLATGWMVLLAGCATAPKIDWNSRIGNYTFDQAVLELGPPDRYAKLGDGSVVAEWLTQRGLRYGHVSTYFGYTYGDPYWHPAPVYHSEPTSPDYFIRLTFGPEGKLTAWKRVRR